jgi:hypothetical protein
MSAAQSIYIEAPVERVFDWFRDPRNWLTLTPAPPRWEEIASAHVTEEGLGTFHVWAMTPLPGVRFEPFAVCTEFVPNKRIVDRWSLPFYGSYTYSFDAEGSGTRLTLQRHPRSFWRLRPLDRLVDRFETRSNEQFLGKLKTLLESTDAPAKSAV